MSEPRRGVDVTEFGAVGDGRTDCTEAFERAVAAIDCADNATLYVPDGIFEIRRPIRLDPC